MDYKLNSDSLEIKIGSNTFVNHGKYFEETQNHKPFMELCEKMDQALAIPNGYFKMNLREAESCNEVVVEVYSNTGIGKGLLQDAVYGIDWFFHEEKIYAEIEDPNDNEPHWFVDDCRKYGFTWLNLRKRYTEYSDYLNSKEWIEKRNIALNYADHKCSKCSNKEHLHIHHLNYSSIGDELQGDLLVVCKKCHKDIHNKN